VHRDLDAVVAGLTLEYNSGAVEGTRQPHQSAQAGHVRARETRPAPQAHTPGVTPRRGVGDIAMSRLQLGTRQRPSSSGKVIAMLPAEWALVGTVVELDATGTRNLRDGTRRASRNLI
jgi:hypothetical protein